MDAVAHPPGEPRDIERAAEPGPWRVVKGIAAIITPLTLITALMFYFGLIHAYWFFGGFGVDYSVFELSPEDYILRSADGLLFPFSIASLAVLFVAWLFQLLAPQLSQESIHRIVQVAAPVFSLLGLALTTVAGVAFVRPTWFLDRPSLGGLALVFGVLLLEGAIASMRRLGVRSDRPPRRRSASWAVTEWTAVIMLISVGLFWAVGDWSARVGSQRAEDVVRALPTWPSVVVYSERSLSLGGEGVTETACSDAEGAFGYRYDGLTLITQEGGQLLLLPRAWTATDGTAIVLTKTDSLRLEFSLTTTEPAPKC
ncbi:hypothetical protein [Agromyces sp. NPDC058126]|uniref:hypothetical protein n=1 Tax=Agromyces sp. NPDC058126 TaxID=3346350 RepID=UPI0036D99283